MTITQIIGAVLGVVGVLAVWQWFKYSRSLYAAVNKCSSVAVMRAIERGEDVNGSSAAKGPPLILASAYGCTEVAALLLNHGADVNARDGGGRTALLAAAENGDIGVLQLLVNRTL